MKLQRTQRWAETTQRGTPIPGKQRQRKLSCILAKGANGSDQRCLTFYLATCTPQVFPDLPWGQKKKYPKGKKKPHTNPQPDALVSEGLSQVWGGGGATVGVRMSALPTPRSGYSEHNHSGEKPGLALPAANFSPTPQGNPFHSKGALGSWGAS